MTKALEILQSYCILEYCAVITDLVLEGCHLPFALMLMLKAICAMFFHKRLFLSIGIHLILLKISGANIEKSKKAKKKN